MGSKNQQAPNYGGGGATPKQQQPPNYPPTNRPSHETFRQYGRPGEDIFDYQDRISRSPSYQQPGQSLTSSYTPPPTPNSVWTPNAPGQGQGGYWGPPGSYGGAPNQQQAPPSQVAGQWSSQPVGSPGQQGPMGQQPDQWQAYQQQLQQQMQQQPYGQQPMYEGAVPGQPAAPQGAMGDGSLSDDDWLAQMGLGGGGQPQAQQPAGQPPAGQPPAAQGQPPAQIAGQPMAPQQPGAPGQPMAPQQPAAPQAQPGIENPNIQRLMDTQGLSREQAQGNQQHAIGLGADYDNSGGVDPQEWQRHLGNFSPPEQQLAQQQQEQQRYWPPGGRGKKQGGRPPQYGGMFGPQYGQQYGQQMGPMRGVYPFKAGGDYIAPYGRQGYFNQGGQPSFFGTGMYGQPRQPQPYTPPTLPSSGGAPWYEGLQGTGTAGPTFQGSGFGYMNQGSPQGYGRPGMMNYPQYNYGR